MELVLTGLPLDAERAYDRGTDQRPDPARGRSGGRWCTGRQGGTRGHLSTTGVLEHAGFAVTQLARRSLVGTHDYAEGPRAFLEKRVPEWIGA